MALKILWAALPAHLAGLAASWALEALLQPRPNAPWRRPAAALGVHAGIWTLIFALALALFRRPIFAAVNALALQYVFVIVNNAKYRSLREPFVYPDFIFFTDALKHPRLYLPFLGWLPPLAAATGYGLALWAGLTFEATVDVGASAWAFFIQVMLLAMVGLMLAWVCAGRLPLAAQFDAAQDLQRLGLIAALWQYAVAERADTQAIRQAAPFAPSPPTPLPATTLPLPDLLAIQSESFFDPRRVYPQIRPEVLTHYDVLRTEALQHGQLQVQAWGANTIRTEFAFLSGLTPESLGVHRFHPYRRLARQGVATLASYLRSLGYRCICVHPYHGSFYDRDKVLPMLGFDAFIDGRAFRDAKREGPYVSDLALAEYVQALLAQNGSQPLYVHVITMENHGPLHWERVTEDDAQAVLSSPLPPGCDDLVAYARHLRNADAMFGSLRSMLLNHDKPGVLCVFGDHVPIMPKVYRQLGEPDGATDYLVWRSDRRQTLAAVNVNVHQLAQVFLARADLRHLAEAIQVG